VVQFESYRGAIGSACGKLFEGLRMECVRKFPKKILPQIDLSAGKRLAMSKRAIRIVKRADHIPVLGICEYCNAQFQADPHRLVEAKDTTQSRFDVHKCKPEGASQAAVRGGREATEQK
jgi:hypothetical protein